METLTIGKSQDLEDAVEECQSKVGRRGSGRGMGRRKGREGVGWKGVRVSG